MISAAEDIGMADPQALPIAVAAAEGVALIGMPEGRILLAEAVVYLATAPKSNASYKALDAAIADVRAGKIGRVPPHLRDAHYPGAQRLGHGKGYLYSHDSDFGVAPQQYLPDALVGTEYYTPTSNGNERDVAARLEKIRAILRGELDSRLEPRALRAAARTSGPVKVTRVVADRSPRTHPTSPHTPPGRLRRASEQRGAGVYVREQRQTLPCHERKHVSTTSRSRSKIRLSRALGIPLTPKAAKYLEKRPYAPGEHGRTKRKADSDYAVRLREKQRLRDQYGIREKQLRIVFNEARRAQGLTGENLVELLEMRLDAIIVALGDRPHHGAGAPDGRAPPHPRRRQDRRPPVVPREAGSARPRQGALGGHGALPGRGRRRSRRRAAQAPAVPRGRARQAARPPHPPPASAPRCRSRPRSSSSSSTTPPAKRTASDRRRRTASGARLRARSTK